MLSQRKSGVVLGYVNIVAKNLINLIYTPMLLSFVGQAEYGVYQSSYSFVFSLTVLSLGFSQAYVRFYAQKKLTGTDEGVCRLNGVYLVMYAIASFAALAIGLVLASSAGIFFSAGFTEEQKALASIVMAVMSVTIAVTLFNTVFDSYILALEEFRFQQACQLITALMTPLLALLLLLGGAGVVGVAFAQMLISMVLLALNGFYCVQKKGMRFDVRHFDRKLLREIAVFSVWIFANEICNIVNQNVPNVLLGALTNASAVAVFAIAVQIRNVFASLSMAMSNVFRPEVNRIVVESNDNDKLTDLMTRVGRYQLVVVCWVFGGFILLGKFFIERWAGIGFSDAYWLILAMIAANLAPMVQTVGIEIQRAKNMHRARSIAMLISAVGNIMLTVILAPWLGYWAPVVGYCASVALCNGIFMNWYYQFRVGLDMVAYWKRCLPVVFWTAVSSAVIGIGVTIFPITGWAQFLIWGVAYSMIFALMMWLFVLGRNERRAIAYVIRRKGR